MKTKSKKIRSAVKLENAERYLLNSLIAFGITVIGIRVFLQLTGFPQIGNSILHIAHAIWGGLLLFIAVLLPLILANRWAIQASALLSGIGFGLFIDEVGKFITQANDYFFPPALSIIYVFFLLILVLYLYLRRPRKRDPRAAMYHALDGLRDALDGDLDTDEAARIEHQLMIARQSERQEIVFLAESIGQFLAYDKKHLLEFSPGFWKRFATKLDNFGKRLGRPFHHHIISAILFFWIILVIGYIVIIFVRDPLLDDQIIRWRSLLIILQIVTGTLVTFSAIAWVTGHEERALKFAVGGFVFSLVGLQSVYFFLSQFQAINFALIQFFILMILLTYRRWYLRDKDDDQLPANSS